MIYSISELVLKKIATKISGCCHKLDTQGDKMGPRVDCKDQIWGAGLNRLVCDKPNHAQLSLHAGNFITGGNIISSRYSSLPQSGATGIRTPISLSQPPD